MWYILLAIVAVVLFGPALLADRSPIPETSGHVYKITDSKELDAVLKSNRHTIIDFYADWCPPCRAIAPVFSQLADNNAAKGRLAFAKVNVDHVRDVAGRYGVTAMPTFVPFTNGKPEPVAVESIKASRSVIQNADGRVERVLGADVMALKAVVASLSEKAKPI